MSIKAQKKEVFNSEEELAKFLQSNLNETLKQAIRVTVKLMIKQEMESLRRELDEKLSFNGYYGRKMLSPAGAINNISVPRFREKQINELSLESMSIFDVEKDKFFRLIAEMHRLGISQEKIRRLCSTFLGTKISKSRVGLVHRELAKETSFQINQQPLSDEYIQLYADGIWVKCKNYGLKADNLAVLLCVLGVTKAGRRKIIGFQLADQEDFASWSGLLQDIKTRGVLGKNLKVITTDDNGGLIKSIKHFYPKVSTQLCIVHKMRNVLGKARHKNKSTIGEDLKAIYNAQTKKDAIIQYQRFCRKWYITEEKSVRSLRFNFDKTLTYFDFPKEIWKKIRTTNILEREFREVRRRIKVFDSSFNHRDSTNNYANSIFNYLNNHYPAQALHTKA